MEKIVDTVPRRTASHQTEVVKRLAASVVQESLAPASSCRSVIAPRQIGSERLFAKAHEVKDPSLYEAYTGGQAIAESTKANTKANRISGFCYNIAEPAPLPKMPSCPQTPMRTTKLAPQCKRLPA